MWLQVVTGGPLARVGASGDAVSTVLFLASRLCKRYVNYPSIPPCVVLKRTDLVGVVTTHTPALGYVTPEHPLGVHSCHPFQSLNVWCLYIIIHRSCTRTFIQMSCNPVEPFVYPHQRHCTFLTSFSPSLAYSQNPPLPHLQSPHLQDQPGPVNSLQFQPAPLQLLRHVCVGCGEILGFCGGLICNGEGLRAAWLRASWKDRRALHTILRCGGRMY